MHRCCDQPMFSICNHIAYGGIMIQANTCDWTHLLGSSWIDVPNPRRGPRVQDNEITALVSTRAIAQGSQRGVVCPFAVTVLPGVGAWGDWSFTPAGTCRCIPVSAVFEDVRGWAPSYGGHEQSLVLQAPGPQEELRTCSGDVVTCPIQTRLRPGVIPVA